MRRWVGLLLAGGVAVLVGVFTVRGAGSPEMSRTPLRQAAYVWQRVWSPAVAEALGRSRETLGGYCVLAAEVSWSGSTPRVALAQIDYEALSQTGRPVGLVLRVGAYAGPHRADDAAAAALITQAVAALARAEQAGLTIGEIQLDYDCAEFRLAEYRHWVQAVRKAVHPVPLTITALPCWLDQKDFRPLAEATDGYVLQVHSLEAPTSPEAPIVLCDPAASRRWVRQAGEVGVPFRVALPTYGYLVAFDSDGEFIGLSAEGLRRDWKTGTTLRTVRANAVDMSRLVKDWSTTHPEAMQGIVWYRLPVSGDSLNWPWVTLASVLRGSEPQRAVALACKVTEPGLVEIQLTNTGEAEMAIPPTVTVRWQDGSLIAADGYQGYRFERQSSQRAQLALGAPGQQRMTSPGESILLGWLRFEADTKVEIYAK